MGQREKLLMHVKLGGETKNYSQIMANKAKVMVNKRSQMMRQRRNFVASSYDNSAPKPQPNTNQYNMDGNDNMIAAYQKMPSSYERQSHFNTRNQQHTANSIDDPNLENKSLSFNRRAMDLGQASARQFLIEKKTEHVNHPELAEYFHTSID